MRAGVRRRELVALCLLPPTMLDGRALLLLFARLGAELNANLGTNST
jgi:hypothetical protein